MDLGNDVRFSTMGREIEVRLATEVGLSDADRDFSAPNYNSKGNRKWRNHIQFVKDQLVNKRHISNAKRDIWTVTA
ncbi:MAG: hypothetical protein AAGA45_05095, partial [Verrucomicrobiota bacterium]